MVNYSNFNRRWIGALLFLFCAVPVMAQQGTEDRGRNVESFDVNGIQVILAPADNQLVSVIVGLEGGLASNETSNPAIADMAADLVTTSGSSSYSKDELRRYLSKTSTRLSGGADYLGMHFNMTSTRARFDKGWDLFASLINDPLFDENEFRNQKNRRIAQVKNSWSNPENYSYRISDSLVKVKHPYLARHTYEADVDQVQLASVRDYYSKMKERSRMIVVVVGNVTREEITTKLQAFSKWPEGDFEQAKIPELDDNPAPTLEIVNAPIPTTYITAGFVGPTADKDDYWALAIGMSYLRDILFEEIRTKRNLSYAPSSFLGGSYGQGVGMLAVSTIYPDSSIAIMYHELENMRDGKFDEDELENAKQVYITRYFMREMTNEAKASRLYYNERYAGEWERAFSYDDILSVDKDDVEDAFEKYARNLQVGIVGEQAKVTTARFHFTDAPPGS